MKRLQNIGLLKSDRPDVSALIFAAQREFDHIYKEVSSFDISVDESVGLRLFASQIGAVTANASRTGVLSNTDWSRFDSAVSAVLALQGSRNDDHSRLRNLDYANAAHTDFAGTLVENTFTQNQFLLLRLGLGLSSFGSATARLVFPTGTTAVNGISFGTGADRVNVFRSWATGITIADANGYTWNPGSGARLHVYGPSFPVFVVNRQTTATSSVASGMMMQTVTTGVMADGFGGSFVLFNSRLSDGFQFQMARVAAVRDGSDSTGAFFIATGASGNTEYFRINGIGQTLLGGTAVGSATARLVFPTGTTVANGIEFGTGADRVSLFRSAADTLKTDDTLEVATRVNVGSGSFAGKMLEVFSSVNEGITFNATGTPHAMVINRTDAGNVHLSFSNPTTGTALTDGLDVGIESDGTARIRQQENKSLEFYTNDTHRWQIDASGNFIAGTDNSYDIGASGATRPKDIYLAGNLIGSGYVKTGDPGSGIGAWKLGKPVAGLALAVKTDEYIEITIDGSTYKLAEII